MFAPGIGPRLGVNEDQVTEDSGSQFEAFRFLLTLPPFLFTPLAFGFVV